MCKVEGCNNKPNRSGKGYCRKHYDEYRKNHRTQKEPNEIVKHEDYAEIILYDKDCNEIDRAKIDLNDVEKVSQYKWRLKDNGYIHSCKIGYLHRFIMNYDGNLEIDHINHDKSDNRKSNLRISTHNQNNYNKGLYKANTSGYSGVSQLKNGKWRAYITINYKQICLGRYNTKEEAIKVRQEAEVKYFGEFRSDV